jgi:hypothetical protein
MKKTIFFSVLAILLAGCSKCLFSQIPPQYLYVGEDCGVAMPDYLPKFLFTDNCEIDTVWQSPTRGSWLTAPANNAMIRAIDKFGNYTDLLFTVNLIDTVPPTITLLDSTLISDSYTKLDAIYNIGDRILARTDLWATAHIPDSIPVYEDYWNDVLVSWTDPGHAFTGEGMRVWTFARQGDTLIIR